MSLRSKLISSVATLALVGAGVGAVTSVEANAEAAAKPHVTTLATGLVGPLSLAVARDGTRYFTQNFASLLTKQEPGQEPEVIYANTDGFEVGAVSESRGIVRFALSKFQRRGVLMALGRHGAPYPIANLGTFEKKNNPDKKNTYGFRGLSDACAAQVPEQMGPASYKGIVETHPYATLTVGRTTYVADAAANAIFAVGRRGKVSTAAVLPPTWVTISAENAEAFGFPACVAGHKYGFEPVPTDIEQGPDGMLYVTSLPGGPEDGSAGANGRVYRVNPHRGKVTKAVTGLVSATGLAVAKNGDIYVSQLFAGLISVAKAGHSTAHPFVKVPLPGDLELTSNGLFATVNVLPGEDGPPDGHLVRITR
jgi:hypothetical protein